MSALIDYFHSQLDAIIELIGQLVEIETPSGDPDRIAVLVDYLASLFEPLGGQIQIVTTAGGPSLRVSYPGANPNAKPLFVVGHCDTVWPAGTLARKPFTRTNDRLTGPGVFDMKAGLALVICALRALKAAAHQPARPLEILFSCDEEQGSHSTRELIETIARASACALVLEPPLPGGRLKTARKGIGQFRLIARGRAAHAGVAPEQGISAVAELAHQIIKLHSLTDYARGVTVNVGVISGGTMSNVVAASAQAEIDLRFWRQTDADQIMQALESLQPVLPGAEIEITGRINRPPLERSEAIAALFQRAGEIASELSIELTEGGTGGGSDGNFIAAIGTPVLDGLGPDGNGAHAESEHVLIDNLATRAALITELLKQL